MNPKSYLVTGGAGFIGSHLVEALLTEGCHVRVIDDFSSGNELNLSSLPSVLPGKLEIIRGDIRDAQTLNLSMQGVEGVFHLAALVSVPLSIEKPDLSFDINCRGTQLVLDSARKNRVKRVVFASSAAVYGDNNNLPLRESESPAPLSPYGLDKSFGEQMGRMYSDLYHLNVTCLRFFNVFGPRQPPDSPYSGVVSIFAKKAAAREVATIYGDGEQTRDFVFVKDVANALLLSMRSELSGFQLYNVGSGAAMTVNELWDAFRDVSEFAEVARHLPERAGDIKSSLANITRIKANLDFIPSENFKNNLHETYCWLRDNLSEKS